MSRDEYEAIDAMNASTLVHGLKSMWALKWYVDMGMRETPALQFGQQYHELVLEPEEFEKRFIIKPAFHLYPENHTWIPRSKYEKDPGKYTVLERSEKQVKVRSQSASTTWCKEKVKVFAKEEAGKEFMEEAKYHDAMNMVQGIGRNPLAMSTIRGSEREVTVRGEIEGVPFKGRIDLRHQEGFADIKGTPDVSEKKFGYQECP